ncbi:MAG: cell division protein FtsQ [Prevotella sp.]|nr:cell division protein FtsQ [Prevotella sp.]
MSINWKKSAIVLVDIAIAVYLVLAVTAFNSPDALCSVCSEVKIDIKEGSVQGFLNADEVKTQLLRARLYPLGDPMEQVNLRKIEETLLQNPFVETAQCYKTQSGRVQITLSQRLPVIRVKADNGDDYYVDTHGNIMPNTQYVSDMVVATGHITRPYAQKVLCRVGNFLIQNKLWFSQAEQINVLADGTIEMIPRVGEHTVYLGKPVGLSRKFERLEKFYKYGLSQAGWNKYSYISLEFDNQIICKKVKK